MATTALPTSHDFTPPADAQSAVLVAAMVGAGVHDPAHAARVIALTDAVCDLLAAGDLVRHQARQVAVLNDLGRLGIPREILEKDAPLTADERQMLCRQPTIGADMIRPMTELAHLAPLLESTHERWDGLGYPAGLVAEDIPLVSRIVFVCDSYVTMREDRPYRPAMPFDFALAVVEKSVGRQFCPRASRALLAIEQARAAGVTVPVRPLAPTGTATPASRISALSQAAYATVVADPSGGLVTDAPANGDAGMATIDEVRDALKRQRVGRAEADRDARRQAEEERMARIPRSLWAFLILAGVVVGIAMALPLPDAKHLCGASSQGGVGCQWDKIWVPALQTIVLMPTVLLLLTNVAIRIPRWWRRWRSGTLEVRTKLVVAETDDPVLAAASWGLVMRDARATPRTGGGGGVKVQRTGAQAFIDAHNASQARRAA